MLNTARDADNCEVIWLTRPNMAAWGGLPVHSTGTTQECFDICVAQPTCVAVDIDRNEDMVALCWLHLNVTDLKDVRPSDHVDHSRLLRQCSPTGNAASV